MAVRDEARRFGVDVELHRLDGAGTLEDSRERDDRLVVCGSVDQVAATVDPDPCAPDTNKVPERRTPLRAVVEGRVEPPVPDDQRQALAGEGDLRPRVRAAGPRLDLYATVA